MTDSRKAQLASMASTAHLGLGLCVCLLLGLFLLFPTSVRAQEFPTSTPDPEGNIFYVVQPNDSLWSIAARSGLSLQELLELNGIEEDTVVNPGDLLLIARVEPPATPTSDIPTPTLPPPAPTNTPLPIRTAICMTAFEDLNRDGVFDDGEPLFAGVAFTVFNEQVVVANYITDGVSEPYCLESLEAGTYHVTRSISPNETLTTQGDWALTVTAGSELDLAFGSYKGSDSSDQSSLGTSAQFETRIAGEQQATPTVTVQGNDSFFSGTRLIMVLLGIGAFALLLAAAVLLFWFVYGRGKEQLNVEDENK